MWLTIILICCVITVGAYQIRKDGGFYGYPAYVKCYSGFTQETINAVHNGCNAWNTANGSPLVYRNTATHSNTVYPDNNGVNEITRGYRGTCKYVMQTQYVRYDNSYIYEADIDINVSWDFGTASTSYNTLTAITHELGHALGLADELTLTTSMMYKYLVPGETRTITADDMAGIYVIY